MAQLRWYEELDDDAKPWQSYLILLFGEGKGAQLAKIWRYRDPACPDKASYAYSVEGISKGKTSSMGRSKAACLRMLLTRSRAIVEAMGGKVSPPESLRRWPPDLQS